MKELIFATMLGTGEAEKDALRLARSIRTFGGEFCFNPIWMFSRRSEEELDEETRQALFSLGAGRIVSYEMTSSGTNIFLADYVAVASMAETLAQGETSFLVMMAANTLILQAPTAFLLPPGKSLGACPVHLKLLGSGFEDPLDEYWIMVYRHCRVDEGRVFPMLTIVDEQKVRAYFNAGLLVVRPERGLLRAWKADFDRLITQPEAGEFCRKDELYEIFLHQATLAGSILARLKEEEFQQLPFTMNYPLHLHPRIAEQRKPASLGKLITCRYEEFAETFNDPQVISLVSSDPYLKSWFHESAG